MFGLKSRGEDSSSSPVLSTTNVRLNLIEKARFRSPHLTSPLSFSLSFSLFLSPLSLSCLSSVSSISLSSPSSLTLSPHSLFLPFCRSSSINETISLLLFFSYSRTHYLFQPPKLSHDFFLSILSFFQSYLQKIQFLHIHLLSDLFLLCFYFYFSSPLTHFYLKAALLNITKNPIHSSYLHYTILFLPPLFSLF